MRGRTSLLAAALLLALAGSAAALTAGVYTLKLENNRRTVNKCANRDFLTLNTCINKKVSVDAFPVKSGASPSPYQWFVLGDLDDTESELLHVPIAIKSFGREYENEICAAHVTYPSTCAGQPLSAVREWWAPTAKWVFEQATTSVTTRFRIRAVSKDTRTCALNYLGMHATSCTASKPMLFDKADKNAALVWRVEPAAPMAPTIISALYDADSQSIIVTVEPPELTGFGPIQSAELSEPILGLRSDGEEQEDGTWVFTYAAGEFDAGTSYTFKARVYNTANKVSVWSKSAKVATCPAPPSISNVAIFGEVDSEPLGPLGVWVDVDPTTSVDSYTVTATPSNGDDPLYATGKGSLVGSTRRFSIPSSDLARGVTYTVTVSADVAGCPAVESESVDVDIPAFVPDPPTITGATIVTKNSNKFLTVTLNLPAYTGSGPITSVRVVGMDTNGRTIATVPTMPPVTVANGVSKVTVSFPANAHATGVDINLDAYVSNAYGESDESDTFPFKSPKVPGAPSFYCCNVGNCGCYATTCGCTSASSYNATTNQVCTVINVPSAGNSAITSYTVTCETESGKTMVATGLGEAAGTGKRRLCFAAGAQVYDEAYTCVATATNSLGTSATGVPYELTIGRPWMPVGATGFPAATDSLSMAVDFEGNLWIVYGDMSLSYAKGRLTVRLWEDGSWNVQGKKGFSAPDAKALVPKLAFHPEYNLPYVLYADKVDSDDDGLWFYRRKLQTEVAEWGFNGYLTIKYLSDDEWVGAGGYVELGYSAYPYSNRKLQQVVADGRRLWGPGYEGPYGAPIRGDSITAFFLPDGLLYYSFDSVMFTGYYEDYGSNWASFIGIYAPAWVNDDADYPGDEIGDPVGVHLINYMNLYQVFDNVDWRDPESNPQQWSGISIAPVRWKAADLDGMFEAPGGGKPGRKLQSAEEGAGTEVAPLDGPARKLSQYLDLIAAPYIDTNGYTTVLAVSAAVTWWDWEYYGYKRKLLSDPGQSRTDVFMFLTPGSLMPGCIFGGCFLTSNLDQGYTLDSTNALNENVRTSAVVRLLKDGTYGAYVAVNDRHRTGFSIAKFDVDTSEGLFTTTSVPFDVMPMSSSQAGDVVSFDFAIDDTGKPILAYTLSNAVSRVKRWTGTEWVRECSDVLSSAADNVELVVAIGGKHPVTVAYQNTANKYSVSVQQCTAPYIPSSKK